LAVVASPGQNQGERCGKGEGSGLSQGFWSRSMAMWNGVDDGRWRRMLSTMLYDIFLLTVDDFAIYSYLMPENGGFRGFENPSSQL
jgi:hypothetical protein